MSHISVLLHESIDGLNIQSDDIFVDCTFGDGGHSQEVIRLFGDRVTVVGIDRDQDSIDHAEKNLSVTSRKNIFLRQGNFRDLEGILGSLGFRNVQRFIFDIGLSSRQLEYSGRGFSFQRDEPLIMTFEKTGQSDVTAFDVVNNWQEENLYEVFKGFGEEKFARKIARGIINARSVRPIEKTSELVEIIFKSTPPHYHRGKIHPATRTFQAIRIAVNDELGAITQGLKSAWKVLSSGGRIAVISFHSLEDRIVKQYFNELIKSKEGTQITKKPIVASEEEKKVNPRSRSAKLRIIEKK